MYLSVCVSVTRRYCIKTAKPIGRRKQRHTISHALFLIPNILAKCERRHPQREGAPNICGLGLNWRFSTNNSKMIWTECSQCHQLQQQAIKVCCKMIQLLYQWTREANHFASSTKRSFSSDEVGQVCVSLTVFQHSMHLAHDNRLSILIYMVHCCYFYIRIEKNIHLSSNSCNF